MRQAQSLCLQKRQLSACQQSQFFTGELAVSLGAFLLLLLVAGICGSIARSLVGYSHGGCLASVALGFIGALLGIWIARELKLPTLIEIPIGDQSFPVIWSIAGGALFAAVLSLLTRRSRPPMA